MSSKFIRFFSTSIATKVPVGSRRGLNTLFSLWYSVSPLFYCSVSLDSLTIMDLLLWNNQLLPNANENCIFFFGIIKMLLFLLITYKTFFKSLSISTFSVSEFYQKKCFCKWKLVVHNVLTFIFWQKNWIGKKLNTCNTLHYILT